MKDIFNPEEIIRLSEDLNNTSKILIIVHSSPDGDAIGSSCSLATYFSRKGIHADIISPDMYPENLSWIPGIEHVKVYDKEKQLCDSLIAESNIIFMLDHNSFSRAGDMNSLISDSKALKVMIDHHPNPTADVNYKFSVPQATSTCELVYHFINSLGDNFLIDKDIATGIYAGINTDTGGLSYNSSSPETYRAVADLLDKGIDKDDIHDKIYNNFSVERMRLLGYCLSNMELLCEGRASVISLNNEELAKYNYKEGDTEGIVNMPLGIKGMLVSILVTERGDVVKLSFRSKKNIAINTFAAENFSGGGHKNAAGGKVSISINEVMKIIKERLPEFMKNYID